MAYRVNRTCTDCGNRYSYSSDATDEQRDCPYCVALEQLAEEMRNAKALGVDPLALIDELEPEYGLVGETVGHEFDADGTWPKTRPVEEVGGMMGGPGYV